MRCPLLLALLSTAAAYETIGATWPVESMPVPWSIGALPSDLDEDSAIDAMRAGFDAWEAADCGVSFTYQGRDEAAVPGAYDGVNLVSFLTEWSDDPAVLSAPVIVIEGDDIVEADVAINGQYFAWTLDGADGITRFDLQSTVTHEVGHVLGLWHATDPDASLHSSRNGSLEGRTLDEDDLEGLCDLYDSARAATPGALGEGCDESEDCQEGLICLVDGERSYCSMTCAADDDCSNGYACLDLDGGDAACAFALEEGCGGCRAGAGGAGIWWILLGLARRRDVT